MKIGLGIIETHEDGKSPSESGRSEGAQLQKSEAHQELEKGGRGPYKRNKEELQRKKRRPEAQRRHCSETRLWPTEAKGQSLKAVLWEAVSDSAGVVCIDRERRRLADVGLRG